MSGRIPVLAVAVLTISVGCGGHGFRANPDAGADGFTSGPGADGLVSSATEIGAGGSTGPDGGLPSDGTAMGGSSGAGGSVGADASVLLPDAQILLPDGPIGPRPDAGPDGIQPLQVDLGPISGSEGGLDLPDRPAQPEVLPSPDLGPDLASDLGPDSAPDLGPDLGPDLAPDVSVPLLCNVPSCWADLMRDCQPAGGCAEESSATTENRCFANGVKMISATNIASQTMTTIVKRGSRTCYAIEWDLAGGSTGAASQTGALKNGDGDTVATFSDDSSGYSVMTCTGMAPVVLSDWCDFGGNAICDPGACGP